MIMKRLKVITCCLLVILCTFLFGCGNGSSEASSQQDSYQEANNDYIVDNSDEKTSSAEVEILNGKIDEAYISGDFDAISKYLDELDKLGEDTTKARENLEYDKEYYPDAKAFYEGTQNLYEALTTNTFGPLGTELAKYKELWDKFDKIPSNPDSKVGQYISNVKNDLHYITFYSIVYDDFSEDVLNEGSFDGQFASIYSQSLEPLASICFLSESNTGTNTEATGDDNNSAPQVDIKEEYGRRFNPIKPGESIELTSHDYLSDGTVTFNAKYVKRDDKNNLVFEFSLLDSDTSQPLVFSKFVYESSMDVFVTDDPAAFSTSVDGPTFAVESVSIGLNDTKEVTFEHKDKNYFVIEINYPLNAEKEGSQYDVKDNYYCRYYYIFDVSQ